MQGGRVLKNSNSFNSYVNEQMVITMAMMEANFEGVGLSNTQQERVEELRAGLDSFSLTNITAPTEKTAFKDRNHHDDHSYHSDKHTWVSGHQKEEDRGNYNRLGNAGKLNLLYRSQSYYNNPSTGNYGSSVHNKRRGSEPIYNDSIAIKRSGSYLQQQLERQGSYVQQSKLAQSIKVIILLSRELYTHIWICS